VQSGGTDESPDTGRRPPSAPAASTREEEQPAASASPPAERRGPVFFNREQQATAGRTAPPDGPPTDKGDTKDSAEENTAAAQPARPRGLEFDSSARSMRRRDRRSVFRTSAGDLPTVSDDGSEEKSDEETSEEQKEPVASPQAVKAVEEAVQAKSDEVEEKEKAAKTAEVAEQKAAPDVKSAEETGDDEADDQAAATAQETSVAAKTGQVEEEEVKDEEAAASEKTITTAEAKQEAKSEKDSAKEEEEQKETEPEPAQAKQSTKKDKEAAEAEQEEEEEEPGGSRWIRPDFLELLEGGSVREIDEQILLEQARIIEDTLDSFGAPGNIVEINSGPVITQFGIEPAYIEKRGGSRSRVKVSAIASLEKDIALALAARSIRIEAPVPGKGFVGLEVPNTEAALVSLRDVMNSDQHRQKVEKTKLTISLGKRVDGTPLSADLTQMPHLLIAGTTGSGKSVCVNSIIGCLLLQNTPEELQFIMVDPKRVELTGYNGIPHLVAPVVVDLERIVGVLKWVQREMDDRYKRFASISARNILDYNRKIPEGQPNMPYLIVIVDELADLMMLAPEETERLIARLAQMARATGIHLIISTQRPSVDVVTGLIKANFPARIAFAVASSVDSRVILDQPGAEKLLGRGDMLYQAPDAAAPQRMQGVFVSDPELTRITQYWKSTRAMRGKSKAKASGNGEKAERKAEAANKPSIVIRRTAEGESGDGQATSEPARPAGPPNKQQVFWEKLEAVTEAEDDMIDDEDTDELYDDAVELVRRRNKASISMLQRHFRIGYVRAARLIDLMEKQDVIGPAESGSKPRQVLPESD
jgi:S-DNA-T family DNA segregation ATPase FtsK/SpoIIIE